MRSERSLIELYNTAKQAFKNINCVTSCSLEAYTVTKQYDLHQSQIYMFKLHVVVWYCTTRKLRSLYICESEDDKFTK